MQYTRAHLSDRCAHKQTHTRTPQNKAKTTPKNTHDLYRRYIDNHLR